MSALLGLLGSGANTHRPATPACAAPVFWAEVATLARAHRVVPQLHAAVLNGRAPAMAPDVRRDLDLHARMIALNARFMVSELMRIMQLFDAWSIPVVVFKGPVLGVMAYGAITAREFGDLDLLVNAEDYSRAKQALGAHGLAMVHTPEEEGRIAQAHFRSANGRVHIDLHERLAPYDYPGAVGAESVREQTAALALAGGSITTLRPSAALLVACLQAAKNRRKLLYQLTDIAALAGRHGDECVRGAMDLAMAWRMRRVFLTGVQAASELLSFSLPDEVRCRIAADSGVTGLVSETRDALHGREVLPGFLRPRHRPRLLLRDRAGERFLYLVRIAPYYARWILTPSAADLNLVTLPRRLAFLYPLVRLARLTVVRARNRFNPNASAAKPRNPL